MSLEQFGRKKKLPIYKAKISQSDNSIDGVDAISLVTSPAIENDFMVFQKQDDKVQVKFNTEFEFKVKNKLKRELTGPVMIPDKLIYRKNDNGQEFYMYFDEDTIDIILKKYMKEGLTTSVTHQHATPIKAGYFKEHWIVSNSAKDKSNFLGIGKYPVGTWMATFYVEDLNYWEAEVSTGNVRGFSVECWLDLELDKEYKNFEKEDNNELFNFKENIMIKLFNKTKKEVKFDLTELNKFYQTRNLKFEVTTLEDGTAIELDETEGIAYLLDESGARISVAPEGVHVLVDGRAIVVDTEGKYIVDTEVAEQSEVFETEFESEGNSYKLVVDLETKKVIQVTPIKRASDPIVEVIELQKQVAKLQSELKELKLAPQPTKLAIVANSTTSKENKINLDFAKNYLSR